MTFSIRAIIEIMGLPKEHVKEIAKKILDNLKKEQNIKLKSEYTADTIQKNKIWSTFIEIEANITNLIHLNYFCFNYGPSSIEILDSENITISTREFNASLNDLLQKLHEQNLILSKLFAENKLLKTNPSSLLPAQEPLPQDLHQKTQQTS